MKSITSALYARLYTIGVTLVFLFGEQSSQSPVAAFAPRVVALRPPRSPLTSTSIHFCNDLGDIEQARIAFESLLANHPVFQEGGIFMDEAKAKLLTTSGRALRELEMELLSSLSDSDEALEVLVHLWTTERDSEAAADMLHMQEQCTQGLVLEEARLWEMTREYPDWAEPHSRLATLLYYKGQTEEAMGMACRALELKPWHFEALQLLVLLSLRHEDTKTAMNWAKMTLPPLQVGNKNERRKAWVSKALEQAAQRLGEAEEATQEVQKGVRPRLYAWAEGNSWQ